MILAQSPVDVCKGIVLLEWEVISKLTTKVPPLSNSFNIATTLVPRLSFLIGRQDISIKESLGLIGLGIARNFVAGKAHRVYGLLQRLGFASLLVRVNNGSIWGPFIAIGLWQFSVLKFAENYKTPFSSQSATAQTRLDRKLVGESHMLSPYYDPDGILPTIMTASAMWFGQWCSQSLVSKNEYFISGVSMVSLGYMLWYAFPQQYPFSQTFWTLSFSITTSGISLLNYTAVEAACDILGESRIGGILSLFGIIGTHSAELICLSTLIDRLKLFHRVESWRGWKGKAISAVLKYAIMGLTAVALDKLL